jgi:serine/threonine protein kinase
MMSQKIGLRFCDEQERELKVYMESTLADHWCSVLSRRINRKGFHEMFKPTRKLGKGNFATVYEAERLVDHTKFAVKAFRKDNCFSSKHGR